MKKIQLLQATVALALICTFAACKKNEEFNGQTIQPQVLTEEMMSENGANPDEIGITDNINQMIVAYKSGRKSSLHLYTETNGVSRNEIMVYDIKNNGQLELKETTISGGAGTGSGLGSQGALAIDRNHEWLYAVNAGDNSVSSFKIRNDGSLKLAHTIASGGKTPVSVTVHDNLLYVLNRGSDEIHGILIGMNGKLTDIAGSSQPLSGKGVDAPQISFTPYGDYVVVTEKATNKIGTFKIKGNGGAMPGKFSNSEGKTPFGFDWSRNRYMIVSNAAGGMAGASSTTSYIINNRGLLRNLNGAVPNYQAAACWVATSKHGRFAYVTNTASNNVSSYFIAGNGGLYLAKANAAPSGTGPVDVVVASNDFYVYVLTAKSNTIDGYYRKPFGQLGVVSHTSMVPSSATGLATY